MRSCRRLDGTAFTEVASLLPLNKIDSHPVEAADGVGSTSNSYLARCLRVLQVLAAGPDEGLTVSELAQRSSAPLSTISRLAQLLEENQFARRLENRRFVPGPALLSLGFRSLRSLPAERYLEAVERMAKATGESVSVGLIVGGEIVLVARHEPPHTLRAVAKVGDVIPPQSSAMGKAVLSHVDEKRRRALLTVAVGADAPDVEAELREELARATLDGYARDEEQFSVGLRCIAAPLFGADGEAIGAVSIAGPSARFSREAADSFVPMLLEQTMQLSTAAAPEVLV